MNNTDLPALPSQGAFGSDVCAIMRLYIAISRDLSSTQARVVAAHVQACQDCAHEYRLVSKATKMVAGLESTVPSAHVDRAVMAAIAARKMKNTTGHLPITQPVRPLVLPKQKSRVRRSPVRPALAALAAVFLIAVIASVGYVFFQPATTTEAFTIPPKVTWNGSVLNYSQTLTNAQGEKLYTSTFNNVSLKCVHVETIVKNLQGDMDMDVVVVKKGNKALGMDMMRDVAQWKAQDWVTNTHSSIFDLDQLRSDLQSGHAVYRGQAKFNGQPVYQIQLDSGHGLILLLDTNTYTPVNVLDAKTGQPIYADLRILPSSQVAKSMWAMSVPDGFNMGTLPAQP